MSGSPSLSSVARVAAMVVVCLIPGGRARAQERTGVRVDYVGVEGVYLAVGAEQGLAAGDTLVVLASQAGQAVVGSLLVVSVTRTRSVARFVGSAWPVARGDELTIRMPAAAASRVATGAGAPTTGVSPVVGAEALRAASSAGPAVGGPRVRGRMSLDVDARETRTSWSGDLAGETRRRFATPTAGLDLTASGLPGGVTLRANLRAAYRYAELDFGLPTTSVRAYEVSAGKTFDAVPLEVRLGRFHNPYESYSAYWDGLLVRVGRASGLGAGVVAGFQPDLFDGGVSTDLPKLSGFVDFTARGRSWRYAGDVSVHARRPSGGLDQLYAGWSQRIRLGPIGLDQRLRLDRGYDASQWRLTQLRLLGTVTVGGPLTLRAGYGRNRGYSLYGEDPGDQPVRQEISLGAGLAGRSASLYVDAGRVESLGVEGLYAAGAGTVTAGPLRVSLSGRRWERDDQASTSVAPGIGARIGAADARVSYRWYRTESPTTDFTSNAVDGRVSLPFARLYRATLGGQWQWGANLRGVHVRMGVSRRF